MITRIERQLDAALEGRRAWILGAVLLFLYGMYTGLTSGMITNDEAWFLQAMRRFAGGEELYKHVFFNVPPLSAYLTYPLIKIFGTELLIIKALTSACFTATALLLLLILQKLRLGRTPRVLVLLAYLAYTPSWVPAAGSLYTPLAYTFLLATFLMILNWMPAGLDVGQNVEKVDRRRLLAIGIMSGLTFGAKQNIGAYVFLGALLGALVSLGDFHKKPRQLLTIGLNLSAGFIGTSVVLLLPVVLTGGLEGFLQFGFLNRADYVQAAQIHYSWQLTWLWGLLNNIQSMSDLLLAYWLIQFLLPPVAFGILFVAWIRAKSHLRRLGTILILFNLVSFIGTFPRVDLAHILPTLPMTLISIAWGLSQFRRDIKPRLSYLALGLCILWLGLGMIALILRPIRWLIRGTHSFSSLPHFRAQLLPKTDMHNWESSVDTIKTTTNGETLFFLTPSASTLYLLTDLPNPTPYDYPLVTAFGSEGQDQVIKLLENGEIRWVCFASLGDHPLNPRLLDEYVGGHMMPVQATKHCTLYQLTGQETP